MPGRDIVVIGGSSGALEGLRTILGTLPGDLPAAVFVVIHTSANNPAVLDKILRRATALKVSYGRDGAPVERGHVYLAQPDRHLLVKGAVMRITRGPRENRFRPAVDPLFRTAARSRANRVIGIVLSGGQDDGAVGLRIIKDRGGVAIVQDPAEAVVPGMPQASIRHVPVDWVLPVEDIAGRLVRLVAEPIPEFEDAMTQRDVPDVAETGTDAIHTADVSGPPSPFTCPECGGALWLSHDGELLQFHCHVGHRFSGDALASAQDDSLELALWTALRALEENSELRRRMAAHASERGLAALAEGYGRDADETEQRAAVIRRVLLTPSEVAVPTGGRRTP